VVQVWHQLSTRECNHGIISNQHMFLLVHRSGNNLHISPSYQYQPDDNDALAATLSDLSFFIAHSLVARPGNSGTTQLPGPTCLPLQMCRPGKATIRSEVSPSNMDSPQLIFTTSGCSSVPIALSDVDQFNPPSHFSTPVVLDRRISNNRLAVFSGHMGDSAVVMKMAEDDLCEELLLEAEIYQALQTIQGSVVPTCLGLYSGSGALFLLTDDVGVSPNSFLDLEIDQRHHLLRSLLAIHQLGVKHNDMVAANVAINKSNVIILDFGASELGHVCPGAFHCPELLECAVTLGVDMKDLHLT
ncbi:uncharacterized protein F5147DRAFT_587470, partial [Suillus discolor]